MRPLLEIFTTSFNEKFTVQELITFYREKVPDCLITIQDNMSDDGTDVIAKENNCKFIQFDTEGKMDEKTLINLRNNSWKDSEAYYVCICDSDELVNVNKEELLANLDNMRNQQSYWNVCKTNGIELFGHDKFFKDATMGLYSEGYSKMAIFIKDAISTMNYGAGSHNASPIANEGYEIKYMENPFELYHTKWQNFEAGIKRQNEIKIKDVSADSKSKGWNFHYSLDNEAHKSYFDAGVKNSVKVK